MLWLVAAVAASTASADILDDMIRSARPGATLRAGLLGQDTCAAHIKPAPLRVSAAWWSEVAGAELVQEELKDVGAVLNRADALDVIHWSLGGASTPDNVQKLDALAKDKPVIAVAMNKAAVGALKEADNIFVVDMVAKGELWTGPEARHGPGLEWSADAMFNDKHACQYLTGLAVWGLLDQRWAVVDSMSSGSEIA